MIQSRIFAFYSLFLLDVNRVDAVLESAPKQIFAHNTKCVADELYFIKQWYLWHWHYAKSKTIILFFFKSHKNSKQHLITESIYTFFCCQSPLYIIVFLPLSNIAYTYRLYQCASLSSRLAFPPCVNIYAIIKRAAQCPFDDLPFVPCFGSFPHYHSPSNYTMYQTKAGYVFDDTESHSGSSSWKTLNVYNFNYSPGKIYYNLWVYRLYIEKKGKLSVKRSIKSYQKAKWSYIQEEETVISIYE